MAVRNIAVHALTSSPFWEHRRYVQYKKFWKRTEMCSSVIEY